MKQIVLLWLFALLIGCYHKGPKKTGLEGKPLPEFNLLLSDSTTIFNTKNTPTNKPVVLLYYNPHCSHCHAQAEEIIKNIEILKDINFYIFTTWPFWEMKIFYQKHQLKRYPNITAGVDYQNFFTHYFNVSTIPYIAIYGKDKNLNEVYIGKIYSRQIKEVAEK